MLTSFFMSQAPQGSAAPVFVNRTTKTDPSGTTTHSHQLSNAIGTGNLLVFLLSNNDGLITVTPPGTWTLLGAQAGATGTLNANAYVMTGNATDSSVAQVFTFSALTVGASHCYQFSGWGGNLSNVEIALNLDSGTTDTKTCPTLATTFGNKNCLWIAAVATSDNKTVNAFPTNYTSGLYTRAGSTSAGAQIGSCYRTLQATSESPGDYVFSAAASIQTVTMTIAIMGT